MTKVEILWKDKTYLGYVVREDESVVEITPIAPFGSVCKEIPKSEIQERHILERKT